VRENYAIVSLDTPNLVRLRRNLSPREGAGACLFWFPWWEGAKAEMTSMPVAPVPPLALLVEQLMIALPSQADDIRARRQQDGDAYSDNDQEEFSHCSVSRRPQRKAAGIVL